MVTETLVKFHADMYEPARPSIDVKLHGVDRRKLDETRDDLEKALGKDMTNDLFEEAEAEVIRMFWEDDLPEQAKLLGFEVESTGRSGGWVTITNGDPQDMTGPELKDWLNRYRQLRDWCDREVSEAFDRMADVARNLAQDELGGRTVTVRAIKAFDLN